MVISQTGIAHGFPSNRSAVIFITTITDIGEALSADIHAQGRQALRLKRMFLKSFSIFYLVRPFVCPKHLFFALVFRGMQHRYCATMTLKSSEGVLTSFVKLKEPLKITRLLGLSTPMT